MKKVIKPSKQPTKKRSKRSTQTAETAKLKIAIGKISTQLVKDHPKLIKGGGSLGITELLFSKILIKGGKLTLKTRGYIINFLKDIAPQVNKLKQELITKLLEHLIDKKDIIDETNIYKNIIDINGEFDKGLYDYEIKDDIQDRIGNLSEEIKEYISILDIVKKYYILSRVKDDEAQDSMKKEINNNKFQPLPENILEALKGQNEDLVKLIEGYLKKKNIDSGNGAPKVEEENIEEILKTLKTTLEVITESVNKYKALFSSDKITKGRRDKIYIFDESKISKPTDEQIVNLKNLNTLYSNFDKEVYDPYYVILRKYEEKKDKYNKEEIETDLNSLLELNGILNNHISQENKDMIEKYLNIIDTDRKKVRTPPGSYSPALMEVDDRLTNGSLIVRSPNNIRWDDSLVSPGDKPLMRPIGGNPAKYKSTGQVVYIMYQNKKYKRVIYVKDKRNTRYCKINKEYILLSKLKVIQ